MKNRIKKILACVDLSNYSIMVLEYAIELAKDPNMEIIVLNVINQRDVDGTETPFGIFPSYVSKGISDEDNIGKLKMDRLEKLNQLIKDNFYDKRLLMSIKIDIGFPFDCILKAIDVHDIDLVVMANKGRSDISRVLFGSAAEKVFRHSPVPVVSIRERKKFKRTI